MPARRQTVTLPVNCAAVIDNSKLAISAAQVSVNGAG